LDPRRTWEAGRNAGLTDAQILKGMTHDAAYAGFEENERGSIAPGYWASFTFFHQPVEAQSTEQLLQIPVQSTWVHGVQVYLRHVE
jgi:predicted amidohydrolase YtcJ